MPTKPLAAATMSNSGLPAKEAKFRRYIKGVFPIGDAKFIGFGRLTT
jgi:hypothetical protein